MKKFLTIVAALALVLGLSQCRKPNAPTINGIGGTQHVVLQASFDNGGSKIAEDGIGGLKWEDGEKADQIVVKQGETLLGTLTCTNAENGTFVGDIETTTGNITFTFGEHLDLKEQTGELNHAISLTSGEVEYNPLGSYKNVNMTMAQENAILKFDLHSLVSTTSDVTITAAASAKGEAETVAIVRNVTTEEKPLYVVIPVENPATEKEYTFKGDKGSFTKKMTLTANTYYTNNGQGGTVFTENYLCFTAKQAGSTVSMAKFGTAPAVNLEYSINGTAWNTFTVGTTTVTLNNEGDKVYFRAGDGGNKKLATLVNSNPIIITHNYFVTEGDLSVGGNIMYLLDGTTPATTLDTDNTCCFSYLFFNCTAISDFSQLQLPATELADYCYYYMFQKCTGLETAPALPATALADYCYHSMFRGCTGLKTAPALQATELADRCYCNMFYDCTGLKTAPALPAAELADRCYYSMFQGCTELSSAPALPATTLASFCYRSMFQGCTKLTTAPELKATALQESCYLSMFQNCTNLTTAPELKATALAKQCYQGMFMGCTKLSSVTMLATNVSADNCLSNWLKNAGSDASVTSAKLYVDKTMTSNPTITGSLPSQKWSVAAGN